MLFLTATVVSFCLLSSGVAADPSIAFTSTISSISPLYPDAEELQLRCGLNDSLVEDGPTSSGNIHSIAITRRPYELIAVILDFLPAKALADVEVIQVDGDISSTSGDKGYLSVTWPQPTMSQVTEYQCVIVTYTNTGESRVFDQTLEVVNNKPSLQDLVKVVMEQQEEITEQQEAITKHTNEIVDLEDNVHELSHVETGQVQFGSSESWPGTPPNYRQKDINVTFKTQYKRQPTILLSITGLDIDSEKNVRHGCEVLGKTNKGFTIRCFTWADSLYYHVYVNWLSIAGEYN